MYHAYFNMDNKIELSVAQKETNMPKQFPELHSVFVSELPADTSNENIPRSIEGAAYSWVKPTPTKNSQIICLNRSLATTLGFTLDALSSTAFAKLVSGNLSSLSYSYAMNYGGHQFGQWAGQLGDGRAINLGQYKLTDSRLNYPYANKYLTLQLKGAGKTPYSRHADGMAVLRSSIREYLCSEAMYHLGIPTTRALSLTLTGEDVIRDKLYDGRAAYEPCAIVARISPSFLRFGSIQLPASRGDYALLKETIEFSIRHDYPSLVPTSGKLGKEVYLAWFKQVFDRTITLVVEWMRVGFVHGVLNTDNMSLIGETIDYGPYGWIDEFDLNWTPNTSDAAEKRYRFGQQANIAQWNLYQLANAIYPLINETEPLQIILSNYTQQYQTQWLNMMRDKLGIQVANIKQQNLQEKNILDLALCQDLEKMLSLVVTDMTLFYRALGALDLTENMSNLTQLKTHFYDCFYHIDEINEAYLMRLSDWLRRYQIRHDHGANESQRKIIMEKTNPCYILRNFQVQLAIEAAEKGCFEPLTQLSELLKTPYKQQLTFKQFEQKKPDWAKDKFGCSALSCSS